jgi:hypothetical protein
MIKVARQNADFSVGRSLHLDLTDNGRPEDTYLIAKHFVHWLTRMKYLSILGGLKADCLADKKGKMGNRRTWSLLRRIAAKFEDLEGLDLCEENFGLHLAPILKWINFPRLKKLALNGISEWKHGPMELEPAVRRSVLNNTRLKWKLFEPSY